MSVHGTKPYSYIIHCLRRKRCTRLRWGPSQHISCLAIRNNPNAYQQENIKNNGIFMTEFYREMTRNEILPHATTWINITNMRVIKRHHKKTQTVWVHLSVHFSCSVMSDSLWPHGLLHARLPCSSPTLGAYSNSCPLSQWCHPTISSSVVPFSSRLQSFPASGSFPMSQFFASGGQSIGISASASVLPKNIQDWFPLGWVHLYKV